MTLEELKGQIGDYGRDIRLNLESVLSPEGSPGLTPKEIWGVALAVSYALGSEPLVKMVQTQSGGELDDATIEASKAAAAIMAMNNVYYRALHLMEDPDLKKLPARLRMNVIGKPGIEKAHFELMSFAISAVGGCGQCLTAHLHELRKAGMSNEAIQSSLKIGSVLNAAHTSVKIGAL